ncbi:MAG: X-Pro aminopeptidase, partial [Rhodobacter sp.]|nr:X-Pro aminopeptidase [Rhodobacter sp.]
MFQSFASHASPNQGPPRLAALRARLREIGLAGFIVPRSDVHQGEYVAARDERLQWLTGFTGSAGFCIVLPDVAGVFIDGRYRTQVKAQVDLAAYTPV